MINKKTVFVLLILSVFSGPCTFAADSTHPKKRFFYSLSAGYTSNTVYGSRVDKDQEQNNRAGLGDVEMGNRNGFVINFHLQKQLSDFIYYKTGISYTQKQVNPQENTIIYYQNVLKTGYVSIPVLFGVNGFPVQERPFNLLFELGPSANIRLVDKSRVGPDRVDFKTSFITLSVCAGAGFTYSLDSKVKLLIRYSYLLDITNSYVETLSWNTAQPTRDFNYKYKTHCFTLGFQWSAR